MDLRESDIRDTDESARDSFHVPEDGLDSDSDSADDTLMIDTPDLGQPVTMDLRENDIRDTDESARDSFHVPEDGLDSDSNSADESINQPESTGNDQKKLQEGPLLSPTSKEKKVIPRTGKRLIKDFLLPALNDEKYGELLKWVDREKQQFCVRWSHKNASKWTLEDTIVFQDWDKLKGHYYPEVKGYYMTAKQRFRAALYKLNCVRKLPCEDKHVKKYQLISDHENRTDMMSRPKPNLLAKKGENQGSIPTSVICKNPLFIEKPNTEEMEDPPSSPSPPPTSCSSSESSDDMSDDKEDPEKMLFEYRLAQRKQMMQESDESPTKDTSEGLRDNAMVQRSPNQPVPVYSGSVKQLYDSSQNRFESPRVLLVQTFNDLSDDEPM